MSCSLSRNRSHRPLHPTQATREHLDTEISQYHHTSLPPLHHFTSSSHRTSNAIPPLLSPHSLHLLKAHHFFPSSSNHSSAYTTNTLHSPPSTPAKALASTSSPPSLSSTSTGSLSSLPHVPSLSHLDLIPSIDTTLTTSLEASISLSSTSSSTSRHIRPASPHPPRTPPPPSRTLHPPPPKSFPSHPPPTFSSSSPPTSISLPIPTSARTSYSVPQSSIISALYSSSASLSSPSSLTSHSSLSISEETHLVMSIITTKRLITGTKRHTHCAICYKKFSRPTLLARHHKVHSKQRQLGCPNKSKSCIPADSTGTTNEKPSMCELRSDNAIASSSLIHYTKHRHAPTPHSPPHSPPKNSHTPHSPPLPQSPHNHPRPHHTTYPPPPPTTTTPHPHPHPHPPPPTAPPSASATTTIDICSAPTLGSHFQLPRAAVTPQIVPPSATVTLNYLASVTPPHSASTSDKFSICPSLGIPHHTSHHFSSSLHFAPNHHAPPSIPSPPNPAPTPLPPAPPLSSPPTPRLPHAHAHVH
ncbi:unnamed protein product, partial [Rodentolepis nana]|uniref:C2H2-type domain-containing protein n=1 Tax=Rodentolepis nana TaxID=102285 RepID=A0A0R3TCY2_RODNA